MQFDCSSFAGAMDVTQLRTAIQADSARIHSTGSDSSHLGAGELSYRTGTDERVFASLGNPSVNLASLKRRLPPGVEGELLDWAKRGGAPCEQVLRPDHRVEFPTSNLSEPTFGWLRADVARLVEVFSIFSGDSSIRFFFGPIHSDRCRKVHMDYVDYRLICTYAGPGTEWLPEEAVNRDALARPAICPTQANSEIVKMPSLVQHAQAGEVLLMKGATHPDGLGLVHRSPPILGSATRRVVLILSTVDQTG